MILLAYSTEDELVEREQRDSMEAALTKWRDEAGEEGNKLTTYMLQLTGKHDEVWEKGTELAKAIEIAVKAALKHVKL